MSILSQLLEIATLLESGRFAEEILAYFQTLFAIDPPCTVNCVQQLLKSLFGTNLSCNTLEIDINLQCGKVLTVRHSVLLLLFLNKVENVWGFQEYVGSGLFYDEILQKPYNAMSTCINAFSNANKIERGDTTVMGYLHHKDKKSLLLPRGADKILSNYIRLFEPMVIMSLKVSTQYLWDVTFHLYIVTRPIII